MEVPCGAWQWAMEGLCTMIALRVEALSVGYCVRSVDSVILP